MSTLALFINLAAFVIFGYATYFMNNDPNLLKMHDLMPASLRPYGQLKFLTYQCLLIQLLNSFLHICAHFSRAFKRPRDIIFSTLAYPVGSIVVYTFWAVWLLFGRELIFPAALDKYYPNWLNQVTHTIILPLNVVMLVLVNHRYLKTGVFITFGYFAAYVSFLLYIKAETGHFVYAYLEALGEFERGIYFMGTGILACLFHKSGMLVTNSIHEPATQRPPLKKTKQK